MRLGGFPEYIIEDTFFSFESDMHDFKSLYFRRCTRTGKPITTFTELVKAAVALQLRRHAVPLLLHVTG